MIRSRRAEGPHARDNRGRSCEARRRASSPEVLAAIVAMAATGAQQKAIAVELGVSQAHVSKVLRPDSVRALRTRRVAT